MPGNYSIDFRVRNLDTNPASIQIFNVGKLLAEISIPVGINYWQTIRSPLIKLEEQTSTRLQLKIKNGARLQMNYLSFEMASTGNLNIKANHNRKCLVKNIIDNNTLYLNLEKTSMHATISIYNIDGKIVDKNSTIGEQSIAYQVPVLLNKGQYFVQISDESTTSIERFIVK